MDQLVIDVWLTEGIIDFFLSFFPLSSLDFLLDIVEMVPVASCKVKWREVLMVMVMPLTN